MSKPPTDEAARRALLEVWGSGKSASSEMPSFRLKASKKDVNKLYLIQRQGEKRIVVGPVTIDGKPCVVKRKDGELNATCVLSEDKSSLKMTMQHAKKTQPPIVTTHTVVGNDAMKIVQQMGNMTIEAEYCVTENVKSQEDEDL